MTSKRASLAIFAISVFLAMTFIDETGVAVALPAMQSSLNLSSSSMHWVMNAFFLTLAVAVLGAGRLSDMFGHRRVFLSGLVVFAVSSAMAALSPNGTSIIAARAAQGLGASAMLATYAALLGRVFPPERQGVALGTCASVASIFLAFGPLIGGFSANLDWRLIFAINIPICCLAWYAVVASVPADSSHSSTSRFDWFGLFFFVVGFGCLITALMQSLAWGWSDERTVVCLLVGIVGLILFGVQQLNSSHPLAELRLFLNREFTAANIVLLTAQICAMAIAFWALWLQLALGFGPTRAGIALLPAGVPILIMARIGGAWADRSGVRLPVQVGCLLSFISMVWMAIVLPMQDYGLACVGMVLYAIGAPLSISPAIKAVLQNAPIEKIGEASGILNTMRNLGATLCFAMVGTAISYKEHVQLSLVENAARVPHLIPPETQSHLTFAKTLLQGSESDAIVAAAHSAYSVATGVGMWIAAGFAGAGLFAALYGFRKPIRP